MILNETYVFKENEITENVSIKIEPEIRKFQYQEIASSKLDSKTTTIIVIGCITLIVIILIIILKFTIK